MDDDRIVFIPMLQPVEESVDRDRQDDQVDDHFRVIALRKGDVDVGAGRYETEQVAGDLSFGGIDRIENGTDGMKQLKNKMKLYTVYQH